MESAFVPPIWKAVIDAATTALRQRQDEPTSGPHRPLSLSLHDHYLTMVQATDISYLYSSQPNSSQILPDEEAVERVFWQSTPTVLEELRREKDDKCHQARALITYPS